MRRQDVEQETVEATGSRESVRDPHQPREPGSGVVHGNGVIYTSRVGDASSSVGAAVAPGTGPDGHPSAGPDVRIPAAAEGHNPTRVTHADVSPGLTSQRPHNNEAMSLCPPINKGGASTAKRTAQENAKKAGLPFVDLAEETPESEAIALVSESLARKYTALPFRIDEGRLLVVMADPQDRAALQVLSARSRMKVAPAVGLREEIVKSIDINYNRQVSEDLIRTAANEYGAQDDQGKKAHRIELYKGESADPRSSAALEDIAVVELADSLLAQGIRRRCSDLHIEPQADHLQVRYRVDGALQNGPSLPLSVHAPLLSRLKILAGMDIAEKRKPQDGQFTVQAEEKEIDLRAASVETVHGEMMVLRFLDKSMSLYTLGQLGFQENALTLYRTMLASPYGMILVSGPTGTGKTTTLYASINELDKSEQNIVTVEDPVEYRFAGVNSIQANEKSGIVFPILLRAILRLDPDVIMVGEIRDAETARIAIQAALTGHLVLSSIHANEAVQIVYRLIELGIEPFLLNAALLGLVCQRMVRKICRHCQVPYDPTESERRFFGSRLGSGGAPLVRGKGCSLCGNTGFQGRTGIFEVMAVTEPVRALITQRAEPEALRRQALRDGMTTMMEDGLAKINAGVTAPEEVRKRLRIENLHSEAGVVATTGEAR